MTTTATTDRADRADRPAPPPLLRDRRFLRLWTAQSVSQLGDRISELALPLIAVTALHATAVQVSLLTALAWAPNLLGLLFGAWVDQRPGKRRLMITADLVRAAALATLPLAHLLDAVSLGQLYAVAVVTGSAGVLFNSAYSPFFVRLVPRSQYVEANSRLSTSRSASYLVGPAIGGALVQALTAPVAVLTDAVSFLASAALLGRLPVTEEPAPAGDAGPPMLARARAGLAFTLRHPVLRASLGCCTTVNFFTFMAAGLTLFFASRTLGLSASAIGLALGAGATGSLLGAVLAPRISRAIGVGRAIAAGAVLFPAPTALVAVAGGPLWARAGALTAAEFLAGAGVMLFDINLNSLQARVIPDALRSRVSGAFGTVNYGARPLGALAGGLLAAAIGTRATLLAAALGGCLAVLWLLPSPIPGLRSLDSLDEPAPDPAVTAP
ncbi:MFS transporter [Kitasatospora paracochleata]|uniref:MFS family permease n=1 Tax=Kitasatospora paracochleata TaxID=58354 RepID=A0ABT1J7X4_9ACTN|nr:MFS transporter [Kitasatospora paracochleata]MCP2313542.1 MFS family permease [Kitasatospora paracochleata]